MRVRPIAVIASPHLFSFLFRASRRTRTMVSTTTTTSPAGLLTLAAPFIQEARRRLRDELADCFGSGDGLPVDADTLEELLYPQFANQMFMLVARTGVLEMHIAR